MQKVTITPSVLTVRPTPYSARLNGLHYRPALPNPSARSACHRPTRSRRLYFVGIKHLLFCRVSTWVRNFLLSFLEGIFVCLIRHGSITRSSLPYSVLGSSTAHCSCLSLRVTASLFLSTFLAEVLVVSARIVAYLFFSSSHCGIWPRKDGQNQKDTSRVFGKLQLIGIFVLDMILGDDEARSVGSPLQSIPRLLGKLGTEIATQAANR